jgi:hypothetical protein
LQTARRLSKCQVRTAAQATSPPRSTTFHLATGRLKILRTPVHSSAHSPPLSPSPRTPRHYESHLMIDLLTPLV